MNKLRIGFVGVGNMGQCAHLKNYAILPDCQVVAIAELRPNLARQVAAKYGVPRIYANHADMLAEEELDGIIASQPFTRYGTLVPELLKTGVPVFTEKPIAGSVPMGEKVVAALEGSGTWMMIGYHKRSDPATMYAKAEIDRLKASGELGKLKYVRITMPAGDWVASGFADLVKSDEPLPQIAGDPAPTDLSDEHYTQYLRFVNYYIHQVNLLRHLLGEPYEVRYADPAGLMLAATTASGSAGVIELSPYQTSVDWQESALVCFERGWIKIELPAPPASNRPGRVEVYRDAPGHGQTPALLTPQLPWVHAMKQQAMNFLRAVRGEIPPMTTGVEALDDLKVAREYLRLLKGV